MEWKTSRRRLSLKRPLVMAILNITPDSFSDGGKFLSPDDALHRAQTMIAEGADILDIGGESTRPGSKPVDEDDEIRRVVPTIEAIAKAFDTPISIDTTKSQVAERATHAGAEIINDISGLRFDTRIADIAADTGAGLVLMHSRGDLGTLHSQAPLDDILAEVRTDFHRSIDMARTCGIDDKQIALDVGIGFGKTPEQNLELIARLDKLVREFSEFPILVGASRKSFIAKVVGDGPPSERLGGSIAAAIIAVKNGAKIVRVHDVKETVAALRFASAIDGFG